jgi:hypothetical protein
MSTGVGADSVSPVRGEKLSITGGCCCELSLLDMDVVTLQAAKVVAAPAIARVPRKRISPKVRHFVADHRDRQGVRRLNPGLT